MSSPYQPPHPDDPTPQAHPAGASQPDPYRQQDPYRQPDPYRQGDPYGSQPGGWPGQGTELYGAYGLDQRGYSAPAGDHPQGVLILVLGILGIVVAGVISPFAWILGNRALRDIRASGQHPANEQLIVIGRVLGIIGTVLLVVAAVAVILAVLLFAVAGAGLQ